MTDAAMAALSIWAIEVDLAGLRYMIPALPAEVWFRAVLDDEQPMPIVPGLCDPDTEELLMEELMSGRIMVADILRANRDALAAASGWPWWEADRLIRSAAAHWRQIGGELAVHGLDMSRISLGAALNAIYALAVRHMTKEQRFTFDSQLSTPPAGAAAEWFDEEFYAQSFEDAMREAQGGQATSVAG